MSDLTKIIKKNLPAVYQKVLTRLSEEELEAMIETYNPACNYEHSVKVEDNGGGLTYECHDGRKHICPLYIGVDGIAYCLRKDE